MNKIEFATCLIISNIQGVAGHGTLAALWLGLGIIVLIVRAYNDKQD